MTDSISRKAVSAWLDNMGYPKLADAVMDEDRFPPAEQKQGEQVDGVEYNGIFYQRDQCKTK